LQLLSVTVLHSTSVMPPRTYTLSLHDALPIWRRVRSRVARRRHYWRQRDEFEERRRDTHTSGAGAMGIPAAFFEFVPLPPIMPRSEEHTSELQSRFDLVCRLLLEKKINIMYRQ